LPFCSGVIKESMKWILRSGKTKLHNLASVQNNIGMIYLTGTGVNKDFSEAENGY